MATTLETIKLPQEDKRKPNFNSKNTSLLKHQEDIILISTSIEEVMKIQKQEIDKTQNQLFLKAPKETPCYEKKYVMKLNSYSQINTIQTKIYKKRKKKKIPKKGKAKKH